MRVTKGKEQVFIFNILHFTSCHFRFYCSIDILSFHAIVKIDKMHWIVSSNQLSMIFSPLSHFKEHSFPFIFHYLYFLYCYSHPCSLFVWLIFSCNYTVAFYIPQAAGFPLLLSFFKAFPFIAYHGEPTSQVQPLPSRGMCRFTSA